jgi:hypothetical protein
VALVTDIQRVQKVGDILLDGITPRARDFVAELSDSARETFAAAADSTFQVK